MAGSVSINQLSPGITPSAITTQQTAAGVFVPSADGRFPAASVPPGYAMYREHEGHVMRNITSGVPLSATVNAVSMKGAILLTPVASDKVLAQVTGYQAPSASLQGTLQAVIICASGAGAFMNYNAGASTGTMPVPTNPMTISISYSDLQLLHFYGNGSVTVSIILLGFVAPI